MKQYRNVLLIFIIAFAIRLIALNQSLWLDEATTAKVVRAFDYTGIVRYFSPYDFHPPLYYLFMKLWTSLAGHTEIALRLPSVFFSLVAGMYIFFISGMWAAVFFLFNPLIMYYSQEARMYMMDTMFLSAALFHLIAAIKYKRSINSILFSVFSSLALATFYGSIFIIIIMYAYLLIKKQYKQLIESLPIIIIVSLSLLPLLSTQYLHSKASLGIVLNWKQVLGTVTIKNLLLIPLKFSIGHIQFEPKKLYYVVGGIWSLVLAFYVFRGSQKRPEYAFMFLAVLVIGVCISFFTPLLQYFRFQYLIILMSLLLVVGVQGKAKMIVLTGFLLFSAIYLGLPRFHREDWKSLAHDIRPNAGVYMVYNSADPLLYYRPHTMLADIFAVSKVKLVPHDIVVIPYTTDVYGFDYKTPLTKQGYHLKKQSSYRGGLVKEEWSR